MDTDGSSIIDRRKCAYVFQHVGWEFDLVCTAQLGRLQFDQPIQTWTAQVTSRAADQTGIITLKFKSLFPERNHKDAQTKYTLSDTGSIVDVYSYFYYTS